jgi:hypothetical protein
VQEAVFEDLCQHRKGFEVPVVPGGLSADVHMHRVMEVVTPLAGKPVAVGLPRVDQARVVQVRLRDQGFRQPGFRRDGLAQGTEVLQDVHGTLVAQGVHGIEPEPVHVVVPEPQREVVQDVLAHHVRAGAVQVHGVAPRVGVPLLQVRTEPGQVVAAGAEVVVHHVLDDAESGRVGCVHKPLVGSRAAVPFVDRVPLDAVVAPVVGAVEAVDRQQLHEVDAEVRQVAQLSGGSLEGSFRGERADVQFVDDRALQVLARPARVLPAVGGRVKGPGQLMDAGGQPPRPRIRKRVAVPVQQVAVVHLALTRSVRRGPPPLLPRRRFLLQHRILPAVRLQDHRLRVRGPDVETPGPAVDEGHACSPSTGTSKATG